MYTILNIFFTSMEGSQCVVFEQILILKNINWNIMKFRGMYN